MIGRPKKNFSDDELKEIEKMAATGMTQKQIAAVKNVDPDTLRKYAKVEMNRGKNLAVLQVSMACLAMAKSQKHPSVTMFWLKSQAGWSDSPIPPIIEELLKGEIHEVEFD